MAFPRKSLVECRHLSLEAVADLFDLARKSENFDIRDASRRKVAMVFFEPSTRTRASFEVAGHRIGVTTFLIEEKGSSREKGESVLATLLNLDAMDFDIFVVRHGGEESLAEIAPRLHAPIINAGEGMAGHPTQALLDLFTICEERGVQSPSELKEKILFVGDLIHSRVARSHFELLTAMNIPFAFAAPDAWARSPAENLATRWNVTNFDSLKKGLAWASVVVGLRVQKERHRGLIPEGRDPQLELIGQFQLNEKSLIPFSKDGLILHPGPVGWGEEMAAEVQQDPRTKILIQVSNGVSIRAALLARVMELV